MSQSVQMFSGGEKVDKRTCNQGKVESLQEREEFLVKKKEYLKTRIQQELQLAKTNSRKNRPVALQALRRKKWYEKHLTYTDCAIKAVRAAHEDKNVVNKVNDLMKDFTDEQADSLNMSDSLYTAVSFGLEFNEDELLAELERLEKNLDESFVEKDSKEDRVCYPEDSSSASSSPPGRKHDDTGVRLH
ncbi:charged multivesicular body protein 4b-like isoform X2 [Notolabrus celidotus]|uniref:charged multivesicular body protein 4b-like isoform X2 n=1 Tax=Notolabrus celidotus TaxID=1203425 RepID=UPI0014900FC4|nr:charged multivesicular body protein 4b-like isoform X2 [Notolabrus celidotus]XP_034542506.1 charged multivesicular body protein 4b-like isoform X2 [Notolabrus celidotus]